MPQTKAKMSYLHNFFGIDYRSLVVLRVGLAVIILFDLWQRSKDLVAHYTDSGVLKISELTSSTFPILPPSIHLLSGHWAFQTLLFIVAAIFATMLLLGWKTRLAAFFSWILLASLHIRNPLILDAGDSLFRIILFWGIFLPWGDFYSLDSVFSKIKEKSSNLFFSVATAALMLQISFLYFFTAFLKNGPEWWGEWTAIEYALRIDFFTTTLGHQLLLFPILLKWLTGFVFILEFASPFLLLFPLFTSYLRLITVFALWLMHLGIGLSMRLGIFPWVDTVILVVFLPSIFWDKLWTYLKTPKRVNLTIYYDSHCGFCYKAVRILKTFFLFSEVNIKPAGDKEAVLRTMLDNNSWVVVDERNRQHIRYDGFLAIVKASPILGIFYFIFSFAPVVNIGQFIYSFVAKHRKSVCMVEKEKKGIKLLNSNYFKKITSVIGIIIIIYTFLWNVSGITSTKHSLIPNQFRFIGKVLSIDQAWVMFAPFPMRNDGWFVISGELTSGKKISLFPEPGSIITFEKPRSVSTMYSSQRTRKYFLNLWLATKDKERIRYAKYLCQTWNKDHVQDDKLKSLEIIFEIEFTLSDRREAPVVPTTLLSYDCSS